MVQHNLNLATDLMPGGVNSPVRAFRAVGPGSDPVIIKSGAGAYLTTSTNRNLIDYIHGWGSIVTGHAHPAIVAAVAQACRDGLGFGMATELEAEYAYVLCERTSLAMVRMVNSGTEAVMTALRLARGATKRDLIVKFAGGYHGHTDAMLVATGSGGLTFGKPSSDGVPANAVADTIVLPYNDEAAVTACFAEHGDRIAGVILEPIAGNMNLVVPSQTFMNTVHQQCTANGAVFIADEVMTGLRATPALTTRDMFGIEPDLVCLGKIIGGGLPAAACAGRRDLMELLAPVGPVYQAGTLAGNRIALVAGLATLIQFDHAAHAKLSTTFKRLGTLLENQAQNAGVDFCMQTVGGMGGYYFAKAVPQNLADVQACDESCFRAFFHAMLAHDILLPPSMFEAFFIGTQHGEAELQATQEAARNAFMQLSADHKS